MFGFGLGPTELIIVAGIVLLLFGTRLPRVMRSLGEGIVEFKRGINSSDEEQYKPISRTEAKTLRIHSGLRRDEASFHKYL